MARPGRPRLTRRWLWPALTSAGVIVLVTAAASAAIETNTVRSYWRGLWWSVSLIATVGFVGEPPETAAGAALSAFLMLFGFLLLAMVSASLAAVFVHEEERPREVREDAAERELLAALGEVERRLRVIEELLGAPREMPPEPRAPRPSETSRRVSG